MIINEVLNNCQAQPVSLFSWRLMSISEKFTVFLSKKFSALGQTVSWIVIIQKYLQFRMNKLISRYVNRVVNDFQKRNIEPVRISFPKMVKKDTRSHQKACYCAKVTSPSTNSRVTCWVLYFCHFSFAKELSGLQCGGLEDVQLLQKAFWFQKKKASRRIKKK